MKILILLAVIIAFLICIMLIRTLSLRPTEAKMAKVVPREGERSRSYGRILSKMIRVETVSSRFLDEPEKFRRFQEILEKSFPLVHKYCTKWDLDGNLLFLWKGKEESEKEPILFMSHQDVVAANGEWKYPPFSGAIDEEGNVWGRGTVDTKGSLFCIFMAVEELLAKGYVPDCDVYIASSRTEEFGGSGAFLTVDFLEKMGVHLGLVLDEGGMILENPVAGVSGTYGMVGVVEKGYGDLKFIARGKGGHASAPGKKTALTRIAAFITEVEAHDPFCAKLSETVVEMFRRMTPNMGFGMRFIFANLWFFGPLLTKVLPLISSAAAAMTKTTVAFTMAKGSDGLNVLPEEAYVTGNFRFIQHQGMKESIERIEKIAAKYGIETEVIFAEEPYPVADYKSSAFQLLEEVAAEIYPGVGIVPYCMTGSTDARFYTRICDHCLRFAPLYITAQQYESIHARNENINQGILSYGVDFYQRMIEKYAQRGDVR